ncbi:Receptor-type guanylate cyclase gcy (Partial), partial [Seminavis robusta]|eukprot:Sro1678_g290630.1 Receptor-type guanylate cyclase gcy (991) ;mRNA; f:20809-24509
MDVVPEESNDDEESAVSTDEQPSSSDKRSSSGPEEIAKREDQMVMYSKFLVMGVIIVVAATIGGLTYMFVRGQEQKDYEKQYENVVNEIISTSQLRARTIFDNLESLAASLTTEAMDLNMTWPFVVFPNFQIQGMMSNEITGASVVNINPIVPHEIRADWEAFSVANYEPWFKAGHDYDKYASKKLYVHEKLNQTMPESMSRIPRVHWNESGIFPNITSYEITDRGWNPVRDWDTDFYYPSWQRAPVEDFNPTVNVNWGHVRGFERFMKGMIRYDQPVLTRVSDANYLSLNYDDRFEYLERARAPHSYLYVPIYDSHVQNRSIVAVLSAFLQWENFFINVLPESESGILLVIDGTCGAQRYSYRLDGKEAIFLNASDMHDRQFEDMKRVFEFAPFAMLKNETDQQLFCQYSARIYPSEEWQSDFFTAQPYAYAFAVVGCFALTTLVFIIYDILVQRRQKKVMETATKTNAIVTSLFPSNVRSRLMEELAPAPEEKAKNAFLNTGSRLMAGNNALAAVDESGVATSETIFGSKPIADLFPATTIMFGDMVGFTAWSSAREPSQVFTLLETIYYSFDSIAKRRRVFKVETIGDCYVAVAGLPMPRKDHATVMARFAHDCLEKMSELCHDLESTFGPDTADLRMRIGLNSGPVTAGVLRGEKGRFQLFGDTMNMASRMESTGEKNRIQVSADTAALIKAAGKGKWLSPRTERAQVKGKGVMQTYWLRIFAESSSGASSMGTAMSEFGGDDAVAGLVGNLAPSMDPSKQQEVEEAKLNRLVSWNVDILSKVLKQIMARRKANPPKLPAKPEKTNVNNKKGPMLDEVVDVVNLPQFDSKNYRNYVDPATVQLSTEVQDQLALFVRKVARLYRNNDFHSFEHASHVTMSVTKLLSRIINPHEVRVRKGGSLGVAETSTTTLLFACVISALIHDADHPGVSNSVLVKEKSPLAIKYNDKSVAEQNSVNLAWELLMKPEFGDLQACIYANEEEFLRFRQ